MFKAPAKWIQMEVTTPLLPGHLLQVFVGQWQKERSWSPILTKHIDIATGAAKKVGGTRPSMGGNPFRGQPGFLSGVWSHVRSHVRSLLLGSSLLKAFNPIDGPEVLGQVLLSDPGVGHVEVALVSPVLAP